MLFPPDGASSAHALFWYFICFPGRQPFFNTFAWHFSSIFYPDRTFLFYFLFFYSCCCKYCLPFSRWLSENILGRDGTLLQLLLRRRTRLMWFRWQIQKGTNLKVRNVLINSELKTYEWNIFNPNQLVGLEQVLFNLEIKKKIGSRINSDIHHSKVPSSVWNLFNLNYSIMNCKEERKCSDLETFLAKMRIASQIIENLKK